jgi:hypothetical protein
MKKLASSILLTSYPAVSFAMSDTVISLFVPHQFSYAQPTIRKLNDHAIYV